MFKKMSTIQIHKAKGKQYFRSSVPFNVAQVLGLDREAKKQRIAWRVKNGEVVVSNA